MKHSLIRIGFWLLLPLSAAQGLWLRHTALRLDEADGPRNGSSGQGREIHLLAMGDSIIAGVGTGRTDCSLPVRFAQALAITRQCRVHWRIEGKNGADISQLRQSIRHLDQTQEADVILISIGVNDVTGLSSTQRWHDQINALIVELKNRWPDARTIFVGLPPMGRFPLPPQPLRFTLGLRASALDRIASAVIAQQVNMLHIPTDLDPTKQEFCADGFHPSAESCAFWAKELALRFEAVNLAP